MQLDDDRPSKRAAGRIAALIVLCLFLTAEGVGAQEAPYPPEPIPESEAGAEYAEVLRYSRVDRGLTYVGDPDAEISVEGPEAATNDLTLDEDSLRTLLIAVALAVLGIVLLVFFRYGGLGSLSTLGASEDRPGRKARMAGPETPGDLTPVERFLEEVAAVPDRRRALMLLANRALETTARLHRLRAARSRTGRDILRNVPTDWPHRAALHTIVELEELVQFGGRPLSEDRFADCLRTAQPLLQDQAA
ncbi:MAG: DUF4129 domain-containing protein [Pseudomonadota bacterium]